MTTTANPGLKPHVLDTRPIFASGGTPCGAVDQAVQALRPRQALELLVPFEPAPLYQKLAALGFTHEASQLEDGSWRVLFTPTEGAGTVPPGAVRCGCSEH
jgi:hypothetical protein